MLRGMRRFAPGFELYTARGLLAKDFAGTLEAVAKLGYREVYAQLARWWSVASA